MSSNYELTKGLKLYVSKDPVSDLGESGIVWVGFSCSMNEFSYTGGEKGDIDVTTFCSMQMEQVNGLSSPAEVSLSGNWVIDDEGQEILRDAYKNDSMNAYRIVFPNGNGYEFLAEVRSLSFTAGINSVVSGSFSLRLNGDIVGYTEII